MYSLFKKYIGYQKVKAVVEIRTRFDLCSCIPRNFRRRFNMYIYILC